MNSKLPETRIQNLGRILAIQREISGKSAEEIAGYLGISSDDLMKFESGEVSPSLPQLESLAKLFNIPLGLLLSKDSDQTSQEIAAEKFPSVIALRNRIIAVMIKRARLDQNRPLEEIAESAEIGTAILEEYESGKVSIPLPHLEEICGALGLTLPALESAPAQTAAPAAEPPSQPAQGMPQLPPDLYAFVMNTSNLPYIQLAKRLSEMDAAKLRDIAEGLLEITY